MATIETLKSEHDVNQGALARAAGISASSFKRYRRRILCGDPPVRKPGAKKVAPIDLCDLKRQIRDLHHGRKRTADTGRVYRANSHRVSRREFNELVRQVRTEHNRSGCKVRWLRPDLAWALDGMQFTGCHVQNLQDLCSRYKFAPMTTAHMPCGEEIAGHLDRHLSRFGPPLFLKRDNGGNLNHRMVNTVLEDRMIIPINSPCYTASYNGAIEHSQGEIKGWLKRCKAAVNTICELALLVENAAHALNHRTRRSLFNKNACHVYFDSFRLRYDKRRRRQIYDWITELAVDLSYRCGKNKIDPNAFRIASRKWLEKHNLILIQNPEMVT